MIQNRANLDESQSSRFYIILTVILVILSLAGLYLYFVVLRQTEGVTPTIEPDTNFPTRSFNPPSPTLTTKSEFIEPDTSEPTLAPGTKGGFADESEQISNGILTTDSFMVKYSPNRELYKTYSGSNTRYTLYSSSGRIAIHVGPTWSWSHPGRSFTSDFKVSDQPTFVYKITSQTIVDFQVDKTKYTIQCVHGGDSAQKSECDQLLSDFKLL
jgi:hypothetical protein